MKIKGYILSIIIINLAIVLCIHYLFLSEGIYYQSFGEKLATDRLSLL